MSTGFKKRSLRAPVAAFCLFASVFWVHAQSANPSGSLFIFPRFVAFDDIDSGIAIFNPSHREATVLLTIRNRDGGLTAGTVNPVTVRVPALGQIARTGGQLFGAAGGLDAVLTVSSSTPGLQVYYQTFDFGGSFLDGAAPPEASTSLVFPVIPGPSEGESEIDLSNPNDRATGVELSLWNFNGNLLGKTTVQVPAGGAFRGLTRHVFPASTPLQDASHVTAASKAVNLFSQAQSVSGTSLFAGFTSVPAPGGVVDLAALNALSLSQTSNSGVIPFFRTEGQYASTLSIANVEPAQIQVTVTAVADNGSTIGTRQIQLRGNGGIRTLLRNVIPELGVTERQGWLLLQASGRIAAAVITGRSDAPSLSAVPMQRTPKLEMVIPQVVLGAGATTEITLVNASARTSYPELFVVEPDGTTVGVHQITVPPSARISQRITSLLPEVVGQVGGYVYIRANEPLFSTALVWSDSGSTVSAFTPASVTTEFAPAPLSTFAVTGKVTLNGRPAAGFRVVISGPVGKTATTDAEGAYVLKGLTPGRYSMAVDQFGFQFVPAQTNFEITTASLRQDFHGTTDPNAIVVQPATLSVGSPDTMVSIFGSGFDGSSEAFVGPVRLATSFVDPTRVQAVIPSHMMSSPSTFGLFVITGGNGPNRRVSASYSMVVFQDRPTLASITTPGNIVEGNPGTTIRLLGTGFLSGAQVKVNGTSSGISVNLVSESEIVAYLPASYFARGGIFPVTVQNPYPANIESNVQLLTVFYPAPAVQDIAPRAVPARLEPGAGALNLELFGFGFRRGAVVYFRNKPMATTYCEVDAFCLSVRLSARIPAEELRDSGFGDVVVRNPDPSLAASEIVFLRIDGLQPTITSVLPGSASVLNLPFQFSMPVVVNGTNFGQQTRVRIYRAGDTPGTFSDSGVQVLSSTQLYVSMKVDFQNGIGEWKVEVANPPPGGGQSEPVSFFISEVNFVANPFLVSLTPSVVPAGGPSFTLTVNGTNLRSGALIQFYSTPLATTFVSDRQLRAEVPASLIEFAGRVPISVTNPDVGGTSNRLFLDIR